MLQYNNLTVSPSCSFVPYPEWWTSNSQYSNKPLHVAKLVAKIGFHSFFSHYEKI